jgi:hypothetical protein
MTSIPSKDTKQYVQLNSTDVLGNLAASRNMNLTKPGYAQLAKKVKYILQHATNASSPNNFGVVYNVVFDPVQYCYVAITSNGVFNSSGPDNVTTWAKDTGTNAPGSSTDGAFWNGSLYVFAQTTYVAKKTSGTWTRISTVGVAPDATTASLIHTCEINVGNDTLCYCDGNKVRQINPDDTAGIALTVPKNFVLNTLGYVNDVFHVGSYNTNGGNAKMFLWDGTSQGPTATFDAKSQMVASVCEYSGTAAMVNSFGQLCLYTGGEYKQVGAFPSYFTEEHLFAGTSVHRMPLVPKGMKGIGELIYINIGNSMVGAGSGYKKGIPYMPSGVWIYDPKVGGPYHMYAPAVHNADESIGQSQIQNQAGAIMFLAEPAVTAGSIPNAANATEMMFGAQLIKTNDSSGNIYNCLCSPTTGFNKGYLITAKILSLAEEDIVQYIRIKWKNLKNATDKLKISFRNLDKYALPFVSGTFPDGGYISWTATNTFTTTSTLFANVVKGDQIEVLAGVGSGNIAYVSSITLVTGTYTVVLDAAIGGTTGNTGNVQVANFEKVQTIGNDKPKGVIEIPMTKTSKWSQVMVELEGEGEEVMIEEIEVINKSRKNPVV